MFDCEFIQVQVKQQVASDYTPVPWPDIQLGGWLKDKLTAIEVPKKIIIRDEPLPKTAVGKLSKRDLLIAEGIKKR